MARASRRRRGCNYFADGWHRFAWRKIHGTYGWHCLCVVPPTTREVELLEEASARTDAIRDLRWGQEQGEQVSMEI